MRLLNFLLVFLSNLYENFFCQANRLNVDQRDRGSAAEGYIYRHRLITRLTTSSSLTRKNYDSYSAPTLTSFFHYYQPSPTFTNEYASSNQAESVCPRQKNVHRNCQDSCRGTNQNTNCRHQTICVCDHKCGFSCLSRSKKRQFPGSFLFL